MRQAHVSGGDGNPATAGSILSTAMSQLHERSWQLGLTPASLALLLSVLQTCGVRPDPAWLDACLVAATAGTQSQAETHQTQGPGVSHVIGVLNLLQALVKLSYQPPPQVTDSMLSVLEDAMVPVNRQAGVEASSPSLQASLPSTVVSDAAAQLAALQVQADAQWCSRAVAAVLQSPGGKP